MRELISGPFKVSLMIFPGFFYIITGEEVHIYSFVIPFFQHFFTINLFLVLFYNFLASYIAQFKMAAIGDDEKIRNYDIFLFYIQFYLET